MSVILVVAESDGSKVREAGLELVTLARELSGATGWAVEGVVLGASPAGAAADLARRAGIRVHAVADPQLQAYTAEAWIAALKGLVAERSPELVLVTHGPQGWDFAHRLAARCGGASAAECTSVQSLDGRLVFTRKAFNGKLELSLELVAAPRVATIQRGARPSAEPSATAGEVVERAASLPDLSARTRFLGVSEGHAGKVDLTQAEIIVSGGRALGGPEKFSILRELADALGGQVGASRPVTDSGWLPAEHQVGSSGVTVKPKLYLACGISGAIQHVVGMKSSDFIIAINKDPKAPIFEVAHVGVVGDLFEIVPALTAAVKDVKAR